MSKSQANRVFNAVLEIQHPFRAENLQVTMAQKGESVELNELREFLKGLVSPGHVLTIENKKYKLDSSICLI